MSAEREVPVLAEHGQRIRRMSVAEFRKLGLLQELNRRFLHPLGLAMEVIVEEDGSAQFGEVWDYRDDPEGMGFSPKEALNIDAAITVDAALEAKREARERVFGAFVQPIDRATGLPVVKEGR